MRWLAILFLITALLGGCSSETPSDPDWGAESLAASGKADGLLDIAQRLEPGGDVVTGNVGAAQVNVYTMDLQRTDQVRFTMTVTSGDLNPHLSFFRGTSSYIRSDDWQRLGDTLVKDYTVEDAGQFLVAVRAFLEEGLQPLGPVLGGGQLVVEVALQPAPDGRGYWIADDAGNVYAFGSASFHGSAGDLALNEPIVGMAATADGDGYWLVAVDGGVFAYGAAPFLGSTGGQVLASPVVGLGS